MYSMPPLDVAVVRTGHGYPAVAPYHPHEAYPEYPFRDAISAEPNHAYSGVRDALRLLGLDKENFGTPRWNPLGHLVKPGMRVVIKPNFVLSRHSEKGDLWSVVTHPSVLRAIADYAYIALKGSGTIEFADAPQFNANFEELMSRSKLRDVAGFMSAPGGIVVAVHDLRNYWSPRRHHFSHTKPLSGDPRGSLTVDLGSKSALVGKGSDKFYGAVYHRHETIRHHSDGHHEYQVSRTLYDADVFISVPKLKVHKKVGVTLNAKGMVGTATNKNYLVHYTLSTPVEGGDQFPEGWLTPWEKICIRTERWMYDTFLAKRKVVMDRIHQFAYWLHGRALTKMGLFVSDQKRILDAGNWWGNDSAWRMTVDLLRSIMFADGKGVLHDKPVRRTFSVIDGIIGGDNRGPLVPDAKHSNVIIAGEHFLATDLVATRLMGFDYRMIKMYQYALSDPYFDFGIRSPSEIAVHSEDASFRNAMHDTSSRFLDFLPHPGWVGYLEIGGNPQREVDFFRTVPASLKRSEEMRAIGC